MRDLWVFGYGSLMWRPDFPHVETVPATLIGAHRALCIYSHVHRGTPERPGLVMALDRGGACRGLAFKVAAGDADEAVTMLRAREQVTMVYREVHRPIRLTDGGTGRNVPALCYVADRRHPQYAGALGHEEMLRLVRNAHGHAGANADYVLSTVRHMRQMGIRDAALEALARALEDHPDPAISRIV